MLYFKDYIMNCSKFLIENISKHSIYHHADVPESVVKGICRVLLLTIPRYHQNSSRRLVLDLLKVLLEKHNAIQFLSAVLADYAGQFKSTAAS